MWNGKMKAVTFSYDDGNLDDVRLVGLFNKYSIKATFNLNSGSLCSSHHWEYTIGETNKTVRHLCASQIGNLYDGHEVACHTLSHPDLTKLSDEQIYNQLWVDKKYLKALFGYEPDGMAYPFGTYNDKCIEILRKLGFIYARTCIHSHGFDMPEEPLILAATCHHSEPTVFELIEKFVNIKPDRPQMFYIWGHSYEFVTEEDWARFEEILSRLSGHDDIYYATNHDVISEYLASEYAEK